MQKKQMQAPQRPLQNPLRLRRKQTKQKMQKPQAPPPPRRAMTLAKQSPPKLQKAANWELKLQRAARNEKAFKILLRAFSFGGSRF